METILSIIAIIFSVLSGVFSFYTFWWTSRRDRRQATLEAYNRLQSEVFDNLNLYTPADIRDICMDAKSSEYKALSGYVARIEHFCVGLNNRIYDKNTFYALAHGYFDGHQIRNRIEPLIEAKNQSKNTKEVFYDDTLSVLVWMDEKAKKIKNRRCKK